MKSIATEYGNWLNKSRWNHFCTFTTNYSLTKAGAYNVMERLFKQLKKLVNNVRVFWVIERYREKHGCHVHALIAFESLPVQMGIKEQTLIKRAWSTVSGGRKGSGCNAVVLPYEPQQGASHYVTKYIGSPNAEYNIMF